MQSLVNSLWLHVELPAIPHRTWNFRLCSYSPLPHCSLVVVAKNMFHPAWTTWVVSLMSATTAKCRRLKELLKLCLTWGTAGSGAQKAWVGLTNWGDTSWANDSTSFSGRWRLKVAQRRLFSYEQQWVRASMKWKPIGKAGDSTTTRSRRSHNRDHLWRTVLRGHLLA